MDTTRTDEPAPSRRLVLATVAAAAAAASLLAACAVQAVEVAAHYIVRARKPEGGFAEVGRLVINPDGRGELTVIATGADADRLKRAWDTVSGRAELTTKYRDAAGGLTGSTVARGAPEYGAAIADVMSREFGYFLSATSDTRR